MTTFYKSLFCFILLFQLRNNSYCQIAINEISNNNGSVICDQTEKTSDWIELYNSGHVSVNLQNYSITDDSTNLMKWKFPNISIAAKSHLLLFASGKDTLIQTYWHLNFKLEKNGETIILSDPNKIILDQYHVTALHLDNSVGRSPDGNANWCIFDIPTPKTTNNNSQCFTGYEPDPIFSLDAGFYLPAQTISLSTPSPTGIIKYTESGSPPTNSSTTFTKKIQIGKTLILSAKVLSTGNLLPSNTVKKTYFINEGKLDLPVFSISMKPEDLWDEKTGIYVNFEQDWEKLCHIEYFDKQKVKQFELDAGIKIRGNSSRRKPQKSFKILCRNEYGTSSLHFPLIPEKKYITSYKRFNLRNAGQDYGYARFRDAFMQRVLKDSPVDRMAYEPALVFLNGEYWGEYETREQQTIHYIESNHGVPKDQVDLLYQMGSNIRASAGSVDNFYTMYNRIMDGDPENSNFYNSANKVLDLESFANYFIGEIYYYNEDWIDHTLSANNIKLWSSRTPEGKWRYMFWDLDYGSGLKPEFTPDVNNLAMVVSPEEANLHSDLFKKMLDNAQFKNYFVNRYADLMNTVFQYDSLKVIAYDMRDSIESSMSRHQKRWDGSYSKWYNSVDKMIDWHIKRISFARKHLEDEFKLVKQVDVTLDVFPSGAGRIKINTIVPHNLPWSGVYYDGVPVKITAIPNPGYTFQYWETNKMVHTADSNNTTITLNVNADNTLIAYFSGELETSPKIAFNEINYHSDSTMNSGDWVELHNYGDFAIDLTGWKFKDKDSSNVFEIPFGTVIQPNDYIVFVNDTQKFIHQYPSVDNFIGQLPFGLKNSSDQISLLDNTNKLVLSVTYSDSLPWPEDADGQGKTLELKYHDKNLNESTNWFSGCMGGSPGKAFSPCRSEIIFSEICYNSSKSGDAGDWVELHNLSSTAMDISGWIFKDGKDSNAYYVPPNTFIPADGYLVITGDSTKFSIQYPDVADFVGPFHFGLAGDGELIRLYNNLGQIQLSMVYDDLLPWPLEADGKGKTLELLNSQGSVSDGLNWFAGCIGGSPGKAYSLCDTAIEVTLTNIVFSEINYNSLSQKDAGDWVEVYNLDSLPIDLSGWVFKDDDDADSYIIPNNTILSAGTYLLICNDTNKFKIQHFGVSNYIGGFDFGLSSDGELIRLMNNKGKLILSMTYNNASPWPTEANGKEKTLELLDYDKDLDNGANWFGGCPGGSPGKTYSPDCITGINNDIDSVFKVEISENPSSNFIVINVFSNNIRDISYSIFDLTGKEIKQVKLLNNNEIIIRKEDLTVGIYTIKIFDNNKKHFITQRIVFQ